MKVSFAVWKNISYVLAGAFRLSQSKVILGFIFQALSQLKSYALSILLLGVIVRHIERNEEFSKILLILSVYIAATVIVTCLEIWYKDYFLPCNNLKFNAKVDSIFNKKASRIGAEAYENSRFFDKMNLSVTESVSRIEGILNNAYDLFGKIVSGSAMAVTIAVLDPVCLIFVIITIVVFFTVKNMSNKMRFRLNEANITDLRRKDYAKAAFAERQNSLEIRLTNISNILRKMHSDSVNGIFQNIKKYSGKIAVLRSVQNCSVILFALFCSLFYVTFKTYHSELSVESFVILVNTNVQTSYKLMETFLNIANFADDALYIEYLREFMEYKTAIDEEGSGKDVEDFKQNLSFENVSYQYPGSSEAALKNIDFTINKGEKIALVGRNGSGKTTLIHLLLRLYDPTSGSIIMDNVNIKELTVREYRNLFTVIVQDFKTYAFSVKENIIMKDSVSKEEEERVEEVLDFVGLQDKIAQMPQGIDTNLSKEFDEDGVLFSGGELQKLAIARAFYKQGDIMVLDELTASLDPITERNIFQKIFKEYSDKTIVYISHNMATARYADRIVFMEAGGIAAIGTHEELIATCPGYFEMYEKQKRCRHE